MHNLARFIDTPMAVERTNMQRWLNQRLLREVTGVDAALIPVSEQQRVDTSRPYDIVSGIAIVPVSGVLVHGEAWSWYGESSYDGISRSMLLAAADPEVRAILMHIDSPGGEVAGCFDLADGIEELRGTKPIWAVCDEFAFSAAYAIASAADFITVPRTGGTGSIGVITMHVDITKALDEWGIKVTTIQFGDRKSDYSPVKPLSKGAEARMQKDIDALGEMFVEIVARNRGIDADDVRKTEAGIFLGENGVTQGLADAVMSPEAAFLALVDEIGV